jgi:hypothetical protein
MAIRPEISLQAGRIPQGGGIASGVERGMKLQQLAMQPAILQQQLATARQAELASAAATEISRAQLPGVQAESAQRQRQMVQFPNWLQQNGGRFIDPRTNTIDTNRLVEGALSAGFGQEAIAYSTTELGRVKQQIDNATSEQDRQAKIKEYKNTAIQTAGNLLHNVPEKDRLRVLNQLTDSYDQQFPDAGIGSLVRNMFIDTDRDQGVTRVNTGVISAARTSGMTPSEQEANIRAWMDLDPEHRAQLANVPGAEVRIGLVREAQGAEAAVTDNTDALGSIPQLRKLGTRPGAIAAAQWNKLVEQGGDAARVNRAIEAYNRRNPQATPLRIEDGLDAVAAVLQQESAVLGARIQENRAIAERGTITPTKGKEGGPRPQAVPQPKPGAAKEKPASVPRIKTNEEFRALPSGTTFIDPNGVRRIKP